MTTPGPANSGTTPTPYGYPAYPASGAPYPTSPAVPVAPVVMALPTQTSAWATASLVFSLLGLAFGCCTFGVFSVAAVICGHLGLAETKPGAVTARGGRGMAVAGLILGYLVVVPAIALSAAGVLGE